MEGDRYGEEKICLIRFFLKLNEPSFMGQYFQVNMIKEQIFFSVPVLFAWLCHWLRKYYQMLLCEKT